MTVTVVVGGCKSNALSRGDLVTWPISVPPFYQCYPKSYPSSSQLPTPSATSSSRRVSPLLALSLILLSRVHLPSDQSRLVLVLVILRSYIGPLLYVCHTSNLFSRYYTVHDRFSFRLATRTELDAA